VIGYCRNGEVFLTWISGTKSFLINETLQSAKTQSLRVPEATSSNGLRIPLPIRRNPHNGIPALQMTMEYGIPISMKWSSISYWNPFLDRLRGWILDSGFGNGITIPSPFYSISIGYLETPSMCLFVCLSVNLLQLQSQAEFVEFRPISFRECLTKVQSLPIQDAAARASLL
jgi:hypothetical protein